MFQYKPGLQYKPGVQVTCSNRSWALVLEVLRYPSISQQSVFLVIFVISVHLLSTLMLNLRMIILT